MISVIVPVYNVEAYLDRCVESIVKQTYHDLEIILVDDGSPDQCPQICECWAQRDSRIRVIHKKNGGLSDARNAGLAIANGEYIGFVDSDDVLHCMMYETLYKVLEKTRADLVECRFQKFTVDMPTSMAVHPNAVIKEYSPEEALRGLILGTTFHQTVWNKLYSHVLIKNKLFAVGKICEDEYWTYQILGSAQKIAAVDEALYYYFQRNDSIIHTYNKKRLDCIEAWENRKDYMSLHFPLLYPLANKAYLFACLFHFQLLCRYPQADVDGVERQKLHRRFREGDFAMLLSQVNAKYKGWYWLFWHFPNLTCKIRNFLNIGL